MAGERINLGRKGEKIAYGFLRKKGYRILAANFSCPLGEIDLIAKDRADEIVFIEVKTRKNFSYGMPEESITKRKKKQLIKTALFYLKRYGLIQHPSRFDVVSISFIGDRLEIKLIKDAFWCEEVDKICWQR